MSQKLPLPDNWLRQVGFKLGSPFSTREAAAEPDESRLFQYFIEPPSFNDILGSAFHPRSSFLVASRGCGKTTMRRVIELYCGQGRTDGSVLAVPYTEFSTLLQHADENGRIPANQHISAILRQALLELLDALVKKPEKTESFFGGLLAELAIYLRLYTNLLTGRGLDKWLSKHELLSRDVNAALLGQGVVRGGEAKRPLLQFLAQLLAIPTTEIQELQPPIEQLAGFVDLARLANFQALYILIDRIDERPPMASNPEQCANLLEYLVTNLPIMELANTAFKFFVTPEIMSALQQRPSFRLDRLLIRDISWSENGLQYLLDRRVEVFTEGALPSLDAVSPSGNLVAQIAHKANGSPRNVLRLAEWLLYSHYVRVKDEQALLLTEADINQAIQSFNEEEKNVGKEQNNTLTTVNITDESPPHALWIDEKRQVWREGECLGQLSLLLHALFSYLYKHKNQMCTMADIGEAVYGDSAILDDTIRKLAVRLRKKIEVNPSQPKYVVKVPGGYVLEVS